MSADFLDTPEMREPAEELRRRLTEIFARGERFEGSAKPIRCGIGNRSWRICEATA